MTVSKKTIEEAYKRIKKAVIKTPLEFNERLSKKYQANIYLKREDLQNVRSYKVRGAFNAISSLDKKEAAKGVVCASAGNHAQGVALSCKLLKINGHIFMPQNTPKQKIERVRSLGGHYVELAIVGDTFDEASVAAKEYCDKNKKVFIHPFDAPLVISGQGTVAIEVFEQLNGNGLDLIVVPIGGGGLASGVATYAKARDKKVKVIGAEPEGAPSMYQSLKKKKIITLDTIDKFVDGAAVKTPGKLTFKICGELLNDIKLVPEGKVCQTMLALYQSEGIVAEPAGALSVAALENLREEVKNKTVVCVISGGNNDVSRYPEVMERSLVYQGLKHYFIIEFPQRPGALRGFLDNVLGPDDDITLFEYLKKNNRESGPALVGVELTKKEDLDHLVKRMEKGGFKYEKVDSDSVLYKFII